MTAARNKSILRTIPSLLIVILFCTLAYGKVIHVDDDGQADFDNIQAGIDAADDGDTVLVAPGEYVITEPITFRGKAITVKSETGPNQTTIRMGTPADTERGSVVIFENSETTASVLEGFTITGGRGIFEPSLSVWGGGGILFKASSGTVRNCTIVQNRADDGGGVTVFSESSASITNCIIRENLSTGGSGGVCCWDNSSVTMSYCTIAENTANAGGGVFGGENSFITMSHCLIVNNKAYTGSGGVETWHQSSAGVTNCVIAWNTASVLGGGGINCSIQGSATIVNSIIWGNTAPKGREIWVRNAGTLSISYSNVAGGQAEATIEGGTLNWGQGNIDADPCFIDPNRDDFHLKSQAGRWDPNSQNWVQDEVTSPCIDRGDPNSPVAFEPDPNGGIINMGAFGGTPEASMSIGMLPPLQPPLVTCWKLDETDGAIAYDCIGECDGTLYGEPVWLPDGGIIDGAIELDGIDDYISTPFVLNPSLGPFSVFAWVKGGTLGQVILSQVDGVNWLLADATDGCLMTELRYIGGRTEKPPLVSSDLITDGNWHRIGFVWDETSRILYVDDVEVAADTQTNLSSSEGGLYIGAGKNLEVGSFFSGLIDDVRIYDRAVKP